MIPSTQLRIGNLVVLAHESNVVIAEVIEIRTQHCVVKFSPTNLIGTYRFEDLMPIELNKEWLERLGFHWDEVTWSHEYVLLAPAKQGFMVYYGTLTYGKCQITISHVHTLQNFMFALTGKELAIKEPINR